MKNPPCTRLAIRVATFYFILAGLGQTIQAQQEMQFRLVRNTLIVVPMTANNEGPLDFVLDTGADTTIVDTRLASRLSLASVSRVQQTTLAGSRTVSVSSLAGLAAGAARVEKLPVLTQDLGELRKMDPQIQGIAGQDFLRHFNYLLDYRRRSIHFEEGSEIRDTIEGERAPLERDENRMMVASQAKSRNCAKLRLLLDSGANSVVLLHTAFRALDLPTQANGLETTSTGQIRLQVGRVQELVVGAEKFHNLVVALPAAAPSERIGDGLLPTALFQALYINSREGFVVLNPRLKRTK